MDNLKTQIMALTTKYKSPVSETSIVKNVPMQCLNLFKDYFKKHKSKVRIKYRGSSIPGMYERPTAFCHQKFAQTFAIYNK